MKSGLMARRKEVFRPALKQNSLPHMSSTQANAIKKKINTENYF